MMIQSGLSTDHRRLSANLSLSQGAYRALRKLASERNMAMSRVVEDLILREAKKSADAD
ncbi:MAG TPA: hypothetical protein PLC08_06910 [Candidatus Bipolaricaulis sp.]|nr:hypothetical protein [Candidatus Bipolaricaulis sp.]HRS14598.1 hypothetical protein [Candidatus Bipolaricaulis sp.]HRU22295.1 hypothetical protein [Candidatus Bipolaricaulis sp.]